MPGVSVIRPLSILLYSSSILVASAQRALPDEETFFAAVRANLAAANEAQEHYAYKERRSEVHRNPLLFRIWNGLPEPGSQSRSCHG